ncbi:MAG: type II toxin-antitoxin system RelE/ParE family toxin [Asticcacaulis sp.]
MKTIIYEPRADKALSSLTPLVRMRVEDGIMRYAITGHGDVKAMKGRPVLRLRIGDYRVIFTEDMVVLDIMDVGHRSAIYE